MRKAVIGRHAKMPRKAGIALLISFLLVSFTALCQLYNLSAFWKGHLASSGGFSAGESLLNGPVNALDIQSSDKKRVVGGGFTQANFYAFPYMARFKPASGAINNAFLPNGTGFNGAVRAIVKDSSGKYVVGGDFTSYSGQTASYIARINSNGTLDSTFLTTGSGLNNSVYALAIDGSGKIMVGGLFTSYNGTTENYLCRLNADGSLDTTFAQTGTGLSSFVRGIAIDSSGRIVVGGRFGNYDTTAVNAIARLNSDGTLDATFNMGSGFNNNVYALTIDSSGKIIAGGGFFQYNGSAAAGVARINTDGSLDGTFNSAATGVVISLAIDSSGNILVGESGAPGIQRLTSAGAVDGTFSLAGTGLNGSVSAVNLDGSGNVLVGGTFTAYNGTTQNYLARLTTTGALDGTFASNANMNGAVYALAQDSSGNVIAGGAFDFSYSTSSTARSYVARVNTDNSLDSTFSQTGTGLNGAVNAVKIDSSGKVMVGGLFTSYNGTGETYLARLNSGGSLDTGFALAGTGLDAQVNALAIDSSGNIVAGGAFTNYNGTSEPGIVRVTNTGALDGTFTNPGFINGPVNALAIDSSGNIVVGGNFNFIRYYILRLQSTGANDTTFTTTGTGLNGQVNAVAIDASGNIVIGGAFTSYNGTTENYIARLTSTGALDTTFAPSGTGLNGAVNSLAIDSSGKIIAGGSFTSYNGATREYIIRLNSDGTLDPTFAAPGNGFNNTINALALDGAGKLAVGGAFTQYNMSQAFYYTSLTP